MLEKNQPRKPKFTPKMYGEQTGFCRESNEPLEGYTKIIVRNPSTGLDVTKYVDSYAKLGGFVNGIEWYKRRDEANNTTYRGLMLSIVDADLDVILDLPFQRKPYRVFVASARNIDFNLPVIFRCWKGKDEKNGKDEIAFVIEQQGKNVAWYYKKGQNGLPDAVQDPLTDKWDFREQETFLLNDILDYIAPLVDKCAATRGVQRVQVVSPDDDFGNEPEIEIEPGPQQKRAAIQKALGATASRSNYPPLNTRPDPQGRNLTKNTKSVLAWNGAEGDLPPDSDYYGGDEP